MDEQQAQAELNFNVLVKEVMDVFRKHNPPVEVAVSTVFFVLSEVAQNMNIPKEALTNRLSEVYDMVDEMKKKNQEAQENTNNEPQN
jgi:uncharacterized protein (UPF0147 family)